MVNSALKITAFMIILSGLISAFNAAGAVTPTSTSNYNLDPQQWYNITANTTNITDDTQQNANLVGYSNGVSAVTDFMIGTVYIKGVLDDWAQGNSIIGLFTTVFQSIIYFIALIGALGWILNKFNII